MSSTANFDSLKILIYVDDWEEFRNKSSVSLLPELLTRWGACVTVLDRKILNGESVVRLDDSLLAHFHEIWFFLASLDTEALSNEECLALRAWMDRGGGVLITGDHASKVKKSAKPKGSQETKDEFEGLGRIVGMCVPRARHMRVWDDKPGFEDGQGVLNSTVDTGLGNSEALEQDDTPQKLDLLLISGKPHEIFVNAAGDLLELFPDHRHEGKVLVEKLLKEDPNPSAWFKNEWCNASNPPELVARGVPRKGPNFELMAVWDGHLVKTEEKLADGSWNVCGRIIADSSWHHYIDFNLDKIAMKGGAVWKNLRELYINQAAWLAPPGIKVRCREHAIALVCERIESIEGMKDRGIGSKALKLFAQILPGVWFNRLTRDLIEAHAPALDSFPSDFEEVFVGAYMRRRISGGAMAPVLEHTIPPGNDLIAEAIASYEDEMQLKQEHWQIFRDALLHR